MVDGRIGLLVDDDVGLRLGGADEVFGLGAEEAEHCDCADYEADWKSDDVSPETRIVAVAGGFNRRA